jgi:hypothetical protein
MVQADRTVAAALLESTSRSIATSSSDKVSGSGIFSSLLEGSEYLLGIPFYLPGNGVDGHPAVV